MSRSLAKKKNQGTSGAVGSRLAERGVGGTLSNRNGAAGELNWRAGEVGGDWEGGNQKQSSHSTSIPEGVKGERPNPRGDAGFGTALNAVAGQTGGTHLRAPVSTLLPLLDMCTCGALLPKLVLLPLGERRRGTALTPPLKTHAGPQRAATTTVPCVTNGQRSSFSSCCKKDAWMVGSLQKGGTDHCHESTKRRRERGALRDRAQKLQARI